MHHRFLLATLATLAAACTPTDLPPLSLGASLMGIPLPKPKTAPVIACEGRPDLAVQSLRLAPATIGKAGHELTLFGMVKVCPTVRNVGGGGWTSLASQWNVGLSGANGAINGSQPGLASVPVGTGSERCTQVVVPGFLRMGHDQPNYGECVMSATITAQLGFDPDIASDANAANDDCKSGNNSKSATLDYMGSCPW